MKLSHNKTWIWIGALLVVLIGISVVTSSTVPKTYPPYTLESPSPTGLKAFYTYAQETYDNVSVTKDHPNVPNQTRSDQQLLIMTEPPLPADTEAEEDYTTYMASGQTVLLLKENPDGMFDIETKEATASQSSVIKDRSGQTYETKNLSPVRLETKETDTVLLKDDDGAIALTRPIGDGTLIVASTPVWLTNDQLLEADHLPLVQVLLNEAGGQQDQVVFESNQRSGQITSILTVFPNWLLVMTGMIILFTILWLWHRGKRFGRMETPRAATVRYSDEHITALAAWYQRADRYRDAIAIQADYLKTLLQEKWGITYKRSWRDSADPLAGKLDEWSNEAIRSFATGLEAVLKKNNISKQEFLSWTKKLEEVKKEVETQ